MPACCIASSKSWRLETACERILDGDPAVLHQLQQRLVERDHAVEGAVLDHVLDLVGLLRVRDPLGDAAVVDQDLEPRGAPAVDGRHEALADDAAQRAGERQANLLLLVGREEVDHAVHGLGGIDRVQGRHHEVAGLRGLDRGAHGLGVTHLTDQDHVGVLAQGRAQGDEEVHRVVADLALVDRRHLVLVQDLDRVLDRHDVHGLGLVDVVDHGGERRRLARPGRAGHQDEAAVLVGDRAHGVGQPDLFERGPAEAELPQHHADRAALTEDVDAEPADVGDRVGEVDLAGVVELLLAVLGDDAVGDRLASRCP